MMAPPEVSLWMVLSLIVISVGSLCVGAPMFGLGVNVTAELYGRARDCCGQTLALLLVAFPGAFTSMVIMLTTGMLIFDPFLLFSGTNTAIGRMRLRDDGLDPDSARRVVKIQVMLLVSILCLAMCRGPRVREN